MKTITHWAAGFAVLLILAAGVAHAADFRQAKGTGPTHVFQASYETVWAKIIPTLKSLDISISGEDVQEGYILANAPGSTGDALVLFVSKMDDGNTKVEVAEIEKRALLLDAEDWRNVILNKLRESLASPAGK